MALKKIACSLFLAVFMLGCDQAYKIDLFGGDDDEGFATDRIEPISEAPISSNDLDSQPLGSNPLNSGDLKNDSIAEEIASNDSSGLPSELPNSNDENSILISNSPTVEKGENPILSEAGPSEDSNSLPTSVPTGMNEGSQPLSDAPTLGQNSTTGLNGSPISGDDEPSNGLEGNPINNGNPTSVSEAPVSRSDENSNPFGSKPNEADEPSLPGGSGPVVTDSGSDPVTDGIFDNDDPNLPISELPVRTEDTSVENYGDAPTSSNEESTVIGEAPVEPKLVEVCGDDPYHLSFQAKPVNNQFISQFELPYKTTYDRNTNTGIWITGAQSDDRLTIDHTQNGDCASTSPSSCNRVDPNTGIKHVQNGIVVFGADLELPDRKSFTKITGITLTLDVTKYAENENSYKGTEIFCFLSKTPQNRVCSGVLYTANRWINTINMDFFSYWSNGMAFDQYVLSNTWFSEQVLANEKVGTYGSNVMYSTTQNSEPYVIDLSGLLPDLVSDLDLLYGNSQPDTDGFTRRTLPMAIADDTRVHWARIDFEFEKQKCVWQKERNN